MKRASYRHAVELIALNDGAGDGEAFDVDHVASLVSTCLMADLFDKQPEDVAKDVVRYREKAFKKRLVSWYCHSCFTEVPKGERCKYCGKSKREKT